MSGQPAKWEKNELEEAFVLRDWRGREAMRVRYGALACPDGPHMRLPSVGVVFEEPLEVDALAEVLHEALRLNEAAKSAAIARRAAQ